MLIFQFRLVHPENVQFFMKINFHLSNNYFSVQIKFNIFFKTDIKKM